MDNAFDCLLIVSQRGKLQICTLMLGNGQGWA
jgi:hypothetical protein